MRARARALTVVVLIDQAEQLPRRVHARQHAVRERQDEGDRGHGHRRADPVRRRHQRHPRIRAGVHVHLVIPNAVADHRRQPR